MVLALMEFSERVTYIVNQLSHKEMKSYNCDECYKEKQHDSLKLSGVFIFA